MINIKAFLASLNDPGAPFPMVRDPKTHKGSITATMVVISFAVCVVGVLGKYSKMLGDVDISGAHYLLIISLSAYLGRKFQKNDDLDPDQK